MPIVERRLLKRELPLKHLWVIGIICLSFASFYAWNDEFRRANRLQSDLDKKPQTAVQVNVPPIPPPTVIIHEVPLNTPISDPTAFLQLSLITPTDGFNRISEGQKVAF